MSKPKIFIGADPGSKGSYCVLMPSTKETLFFPTDDNPLTLFNVFSKLKEECHVVVVMVEEVHAIQGSAAKATFNFGGNYRQTYVIPQCAGISVDFIRPKAWQKAVGVLIPTTASAADRKKAIKNQVAEICESIYPHAEIRGTKGGLLDGRSDSLMIAHFASKTYINHI